ncbi:MAG TPA: metal-dependent transcriptional regulator [Acidobacteriota bacterium]
MELTPTHEDYIEAVFRRRGQDAGGVRVTDLAGDLGCRLPTVTRTVRQLTAKGLFAHRLRGRVQLTPQGERLAGEIAHRHDDVHSFLRDVLGLPGAQVRLDACQIEHGLSPLAAERLHALLEYLAGLPAAERRRLRRHLTRSSRRRPAFGHLVETRAQGWRG